MRRDLANLGLTALLTVSPVGALQAGDVTVGDVARALTVATAERPADFSHRDLEELDLSGLDLRGSRFVGANLYGVDLTDADLDGADLSGARLDHVTIIGANFSHARLVGVSLLLPAAFSTLVADPAQSPRFAGADLTDAHVLGHFGRGDWRGATLAGATFDGGRVIFLTSL
jgi:uncharacterized protein YjbI with pentapeptide repeats